jgi:hypothetical protein
MPQGGAWSNSNKSQMMSSARIVQKQGGGDKKAGFPYQVGRGQWASIFIDSCDPVNQRCCNLDKIGKTMVFVKNTIRPVGNDSRIPMR